MKDCPSAEKLRLYKAGTLADSDRCAIEAHVRTCATCRKSLEQRERPTSPSTDSDLLRRVRSVNDQEAWKVFLERYGDLILGWCLWTGLRRHDAEDVTQEVLAKLLEKMPQFVYDRDKGNYRGWLRRVVENAVQDLKRRDKRCPGARGSGDTDSLKSAEAKNEPPPTDADGEDEPPPTDADGEELPRSLHELLVHDSRLLEACVRVRERVNPNTWQAFWHMTMNGYSAAEVAERLKMNEGAVYMAVSRVRGKIRREYDRLSGDQGDDRAADEA